MRAARRENSRLRAEINEHLLDYEVAKKIRNACGSIDPDIPASWADIIWERLTGIAASEQSVSHLH